MNANVGRRNQVKEQIRNFERQGVSKKVIDAYKKLAERFPNCSGREEAVIAKSPLIIHIFKEADSASGEEKFKAKMEEKTLKAIEMLEKLVENFFAVREHPAKPGGAHLYAPFEYRMDIVNTYLTTMVTLGSMPMDSGRFNKMLDSETFGYLLDKSFGMMDNWNLDLLEPTMAKLGMMQWSVASTGLIAFHLRKNGAEDTISDKLIDTYMERGFVPLGEVGGCEKGLVISTAFNQLDAALVEHIMRNGDNSNIIESIVDINGRLSGLLSEGIVTPPEVISHFIRRGLEGFEHILEMGKLN